MPAIAWWPGQIDPRTRTDELCISLDVMPTMLELARVAAPAGHALDGRSLVEVLRGGAAEERMLFWKGRAVRDGSWKLVMEKDAPSLFDLSVDIGEREDVAATHPDIVARMLVALAGWRRDVARR